MATRARESLRWWKPDSTEFSSGERWAARDRSITTAAMDAVDRRIAAPEFKGRRPSGA